MALRFAPARQKVCAVVARVLSVAPLGEPANDGGHALADDQLLRKALWHFSENGLGAAALAHQHAERALMRGDQFEFYNWLGICRLLDRRLAETLRSDTLRSETRLLPLPA